MIKAKKKYSVFIPCYNAATTIKETLVSVQEAIRYSELSIPVYIYDDCSTDNSLAVCNEAIKEYKNFFIIKNPGNVGERKTTNSAFKKLHEQYDWGFIIHADDSVKKDWLAALITEIEKVEDSSCFTAWSSYDAFHDKTKIVEEGDNSGKVSFGSRSLEEVRAILRKMYSSWHISGAAFNLALFHKLGGFDEALAQFGDTDYFARGLLAGYKHIYISKTLTFYRIIQGSVSSVSVNTNRDINEIIVLINKHKNILTKQDISALYGIIRRLSLRRTIKSLANRNFPMALVNFKQFSSFILK